MKSDALQAYLEKALCSSSSRYRNSAAFSEVTVSVITPGTYKIVSCRRDDKQRGLSYIPIQGGWLLRERSGPTVTERFEWMLAAATVVGEMSCAILLAPRERR